MIRVCVESPLRGDVARNARYAQCCMLDCLSRNEAPFLGHLLYPLVLDDESPEHRELGIDAHLTWLAAADFVAVYFDLGVTSGMEAAITRATDRGIPHMFRRLGAEWETEHAARIARTPGF